MDGTNQPAGGGAGSGLDFTDGSRQVINKKARGAVTPRANDLEQDRGLSMYNDSTPAAGGVVEVNSVSQGQIDQPNAALSYLAYIFQDARVHELRFIDPAKVRKPKSFVWRPGIKNIRAELDKAARRRDNCYVTINPVRDDHPDNTAANAGDIVRRWHIPIDIDPIRARGTLACEEERQAAADVGAAVLAWYESTFPDHAKPFSGCSGSGQQILIPADMPTDAKSGKLVARLFKVLGEQFDSKAAKIDQSVKDLPRIMRICGTRAFYSDGETRGHINHLPTGEGRRVTADDLLAYLGEEVPKAATGAATKAPGKLPTLTVPGRDSDAWNRFRAYIEGSLNDIQFAPDTTKYRTIVAKSAHIGNIAAGLGLEGRKAEIKELVMSALRRNTSEVNSWPAMEQAFEDMFQVGIADPRLPEDRPRPGHASGTGGQSIQPSPQGTHACEEVGAGVALAGDTADSYGLIAPTYDQWAENRAAMVWHWPGWIPSNQLVLVSGSFAAGKSTLLVYLLVLITTGQDWPDGSSNDFDHEKPVLYLDADNRSDLIGEAFRRAGGDTKKLRLATLPEDIGVPLFLDKGEAFETLRRYVKGTGPSCLVIDTVVRASDVDLTNPQQLSAFLKPLQAIAQEFNIPVFLLGHTNADGKAYGRHIEAAVTASWIVSHDPVTDSRTLACEFTRGAKPDSISFSIGTNGCENFSVLTVPEGRSAMEQAKNAVVSCLQKSVQALSHARLSDHLEKLGVGSGATLTRALKELIDQGRVMTRQMQRNKGNGSFPVYFIEPENDPQKSF